MLPVARHRPVGSLIDVESLTGQNVLADTSVEPETTPETTDGRPLEKGMFDSVPCGLVICDARGFVLRANDFFFRLSGLSRDAFQVSKPFHQCLTRPSRFIFNAQVLPLLTHVGLAREVTLDVQGASGAGIPVLVNGHFDKATQQLLFAVFPAKDRRDDERKLLKAQKDLTKSRDYLQLAEKLARVGHWHLDLVTKAAFWSEEIYTITGLDPETHTPRMGDKVVTYYGEDAAEIEAILAESIRTGEGFTFTKRLIQHGTGDIRHVQASGVCERDVHGAVTGLFGVFRDITDAARAQERIAQSELRYRLLADKANDIIATFSISGKIEYVSPAIAKVLGYDPAELIDRNVADLIHPEDYPHTQAAYGAYVVGKDWDNAPRIRYRALHAEGHYVWAEAHPTALFDPSGTRVLAFQDVIRDVTKQKAAEDALARASIEANAAAEAKAQFLATMSHELRTPLTSIIGFSGLLRDLLTGQDDLRRHSQRIHSAGQGLLSLINDILDHSKLEAGQLEIDLAPASVAEIVGEVVDLLGMQASAKSLTLVVDGIGNLPDEVLIDDGRVRQILLNLVGNAVKFTTQGCVTVSAAVYARDGVDHLRLAVRDTGPGISEAGQAALFQRFSQVDGSAHSSVGGTGLGLSICKQLVELMHGTIGVTSTLGEGAEFWFDIPLVDRTADAEGLDIAQRPGRLLVVDDQEAVAELLANLLTPHGHVVDIAGNGYDAVQACQRATYDLILMDINMPVMDGFAASRTIRDSSPLNRNVPILALTAAGGAARQQACLASGMNALLAKPVNPATLLSAVSMWLAAPPTLPNVAALASQTSASLST